MPIYEYRCTGCGERFEELVRAADPAAACAGCGSGEVQRLLSGFAGIGGAAAARVPAAGSPEPRPARRHGGSCSCC